MRREAAFGGGVDDEDYLAVVLGEGVLAALFCSGVNGVSEACLGKGWDVLSLAVKSKKEVAEAMVRRCW